MSTRMALQNRKRSQGPNCPKALNEDVKAVAQDFRSIANDASPLLRTYLKKARLSPERGSRLLIVLPDEVKRCCGKGTAEHKEEIERLIGKMRKTGRYRSPAAWKKAEGLRTVSWILKFDPYGNNNRRLGGYEDGKTWRISRRRNAWEYGKSDEAGTEDAASDGRTGKKKWRQRSLLPLPEAEQ